MSDLSFQPDHAEIERRVEALLFAAAAPLSAAELTRRLPEGADVGGAISALRERYQGRGVEL
ncbi:MAG: SMC-Scp complex subunit ScpB, partial [Brevundimonas sp.]